MTDAVTTTLAQIRAHSPCEDGYKKLVKSLGGCKSYGMDTPITFRQIHKSNGYDDTLWCLRTVDEKYYPLWRHFTVDCAEQVKPMMDDERSLKVLVVARKHADGLATDKELDAARAAAWDAQIKLLFEYCRTGGQATNPERFFAKEPAE
jgi:hypothetical protein